MKLAVVSLLASMAAAQTQMQINWSNDRRCTQFLGHTSVAWSSKQGSGGNNCYNYHYGKSAAIAGCWASGGYCLCRFYRQENCQGGYSTSSSGRPGPYNCRQNGDQFYSFSCFHF